MIQYTPANIRMWSRLGASGAFGAAAMELGETRVDMVLLSADMTFASGLERFRNKYPDRHYQVGIAEQNLIGVAAGIASEGLLPFATTYATFFAARALDQIKMCLGYMKQNVKLVGVLSGFSAGILGPTHMALEDLAIMRSIPNMTVLSPADGMETVKALLAAAEIDGPMYIRLGGGMTLPAVYQQDYSFLPGKGITLREGTDAVIFATGTMVYYALQAAELLAEEGINCRVVDMHTIKPLDVCVVEAAREARLVVTVEEHGIFGGLGGAVAEELSARPNAPKLLRLGVRDTYPHAQSYEELLAAAGLTAEGIAKSIRQALDS